MKAQYILIPLIFLFISSSGVSQIQDRVKNKAENKANNRVDSKVDEGLEKGFDAIEGLFKKKKKKNAPEPVEAEDVKEEYMEEVQEENSDSGVKESSSNEAVSGMPPNMFGGMFQEVKWENSYTFNVLSEATVTTTSSKGKTDMNTMNMFLGEEVWGMEVTEKEKKAETGFVIYDLTNEAFVILSERKGEKEGVAMSLNFKGAQPMQKTENGFELMKDQNIQFRITGRSKSIAGYSCDEYEVKSEDSDGLYWATEDVEFDLETYFRMFSNEDVEIPENYPNGYMMEMKSTDKKSGEKYHYVVTRLDVNANKTIDLSPYNVMDMQQMMQQGR